MGQEQYDKSIQTGKLQLSAWRVIPFYFLVVLLFFIPVMFLALEIFDNSKNYVRPPIWAISIPAVLGALLYKYQQIGLKFEVIETALTKNAVFSLIEKLADEQKWLIVFRSDKVFVAKIDAGNPWRKSKLITILLDKNRVLINSIYDPDTNKSGIDPLGTNKALVGSLIAEIEGAAPKAG